MSSHYSVIFTVINWEYINFLSYMSTFVYTNILDSQIDSAVAMESDKQDNIGE